MIPTSPIMLKARYSSISLLFGPLKWAQIISNVFYSIEINNNETHWCSTPKACALFLVILSGKLGAEVVVGESWSGPMSWGMLLIFLLKGWVWYIGALPLRSLSRRDATNTATTNQSPSGAPRRPPPSPIHLESSSSVNTADPVVVVILTPKAPPAPLALLGGDLQFTWGVQIGLPLVVENLLLAAPRRSYSRPALRWNVGDSW